MPAAQLKDLLNPLVKIENFTKTTSESISELTSVVTGYVSFGNRFQASLLKMVSKMHDTITRNIKDDYDIQKQILGVGKQQLQYLSLIYDANKRTLLSTIIQIAGIYSEYKFRKEVTNSLSTIVSLLSNKPSPNIDGAATDKGLASKDALNTKILGSGIKQLSNGIVAMAKLGKPAIKTLDLVFLSIEKFITKLSGLDVKKSADALLLLGKGIFVFTGSLALSLILLIPGMIALPFLITTIAVMSKVVSYLGNDADKIITGSNALKALGEGVGAFFNGVATLPDFLAAITLAMLPQLVILVPALILFTSLAVAALGKFSTQINKGSETLRPMGEALEKFSKSLAISLLFLIPGIFAVPLLATSLLLVGGSVILLGTKAKQLEAASSTLSTLAKGIVLFSISLGLSLLFLIPGIFAVPLLVTSLLLVGGAMILLGTKAKQLEAASSTLSTLAKGIVLFSAAMLVAALVFEYVPIEKVVMMALTILLVGGAVSLLGKEKRYEDVKKGAKALVFLGAGLFIFALGYSYFADATSAITLPHVFTQLAIIGGMLGLMFLASKMPIKKAALGALAIALIGPALWAFSWGYEKFAKATEKTTQDGMVVGAQLILLGGMLGIFTLAGAAMSSFLPVLGAVAIALMGPALWAFSWGYEKFAKATEKATQDGMVVGAQLILLGGILTIATLAGAAMLIGLPALGAIAIALIGPALWAFSWGYEKFAKATEKATKETIGAQLLLLGGVVIITALAGLALPLVFFGAISLALIGVGIYALSWGLTKYKESKWALGDTENLIGTVSSLLTAFGAVPPGGSGKGGDAGSFGFLGDLGTTVGNIIKGGLGSLAVIANALSIIVIGASIATLTKGLTPYKKLGWTVADTTTLTHLMTSLLGLFSGKGGGEGGGILASLGNLVKGGIDAATSTINSGIFFVISKILPTLAKGLSLYNASQWSAAKTAVLIGSITGLGKAILLGFSTVDNNTALRFMNTMSSFTKNANGLITAAKGFQKIADAINSVDIDKATVFKDLFKASVELTERGRNIKALESLAEAIEEMKAAMQNQTSSTNVLGGAMGDLKVALGLSAPTPTAPIAPKQDMSQTLVTLQQTLSQINITLSNLPADIAAIEIKMPKD